ncbi:protein-L-isoaspartate O-methyltransferase [Elioraea sp. Yellowstone]|jgi:protein-L-isoaspartate(D-aspartate) O-methyltransferase|uniref:protein-L-isoaspartate O-methyltransferase family protein n=1 Tax=Elioraea sp. Yellowstone TaxID=2592070 RepID=UPI00114E5E21|nr:protein-L-isoaspartate O-methyltransferase [Elioraea sp. Yellowstone]TQF78867.1 protein-L-isoaspartate O-methyltransferase [Elioraea sp. Yellowstone]
MDFARARLNMVEGQLRPNKVTDPRILAAMLDLPRELFLPAERRALAYLDEDIPLGGGRALIEPMVLARLVQAAEVEEGSRVLVVAAGAGYGAALLARLARSVVALEAPGEAVERLRAALAAIGVTGVRVVGGPVTEGWAAEAPYDAILIEGAVETVPEVILAQLVEGGRLVTVEASGRPGVLGVAVRLVRLAGTVTRLPLFDAGTPLLPEFRRKRGFVF